MGLFTKKRDVQQLQADRDFDGLADAVGKGDETTRREAISAIGALGDARAVPSLIRMMSRLRTGPEAYAAGQAAIGRVGEAAAAPLVAIIREHEPAAGTQLAALGEPVALQPLAELSIDADDSVRSIACVALALLGTPAALDVLARRMEDGPARLEALQAAGTTWRGAEGRVVRGLLSAARSGDERLIDNATGTLTKLAARVREGAVEGGEALPVLVEAAQDPDDAVRLWGITGVYAFTPDDPAAVPDARIIEAAAAALDDASDPVAMMAAVTLADRGDGRALQPLLRIMRSGNEAVGQGAIGALRKLNDPAALPAVNAWIDEDKTGSDALRRARAALKQELLSEERRRAKA